MTAARKIDPSVDKYRQERLADFTRLRTKLEDSCESIAALVPEDEVRERALAVIRPELRAFLSIVLTRAPLAALERAAGLLHDWHTTDKFFDKGNEEIQKLIAAMLPQPTWTKLEIIDAKRAKNDDEWARWCSKWLKEFGTHTKVQHEPGRWARFFSGIEAPWWIVQAVSLAETVDAHMRQASRERAAANEARRPMTLDQVVAMKGGTVLRPEDAVAALRGTYQHAEPSPPPASPSPAPAPAATPPPAPTQTREPTRDEMIASLGHLTKLRGTHLLPPRDPQSLDLFYRWSHDAWTAIQAHAAALEWTDATPTPPSSLSVRDGMIAMAPLAVLRGRPFRLPFGADHEAFYRWCLQEWTGIQAHAAALEWKPPPAPSPDQAPTPDPPQAPEDEIGDILGEPHHAGQTPEAKSVEARVTTIEDEIRRLRSELVFLDLNFKQHAAKVQEEREEMKALIQRQFAEIHHLLTQILGKTTVAATALPDAVPLATGSTQAAEPDTVVAPPSAQTASQLLGTTTVDAVPVALSDVVPIATDADHAATADKHEQQVSPAREIVEAMPPSSAVEASSDTTADEHAQQATHDDPPRPAGLAAGSTNDREAPAREPVEPVDPIAPAQAGSDAADDPDVAAKMFDSLTTVHTLREQVAAKRARNEEFFAAENAELDALRQQSNHLTALTNAVIGATHG